MPQSLNWKKKEREREYWEQIFLSIVRPRRELELVHSKKQKRGFSAQAKQSAGTWDVCGAKQKSLAPSLLLTPRSRAGTQLLDLRLEPPQHC